MSPASSPTSPRGASRRQALTHTLAEAPTLQQALALLHELAPQARFAGVRREGEAVRVLFRLDPPKQGLIALDAEANGALRAASLLDDSPQVGRRGPPGDPEA